jgi:cytochrome c biogenesis factor
MREWPIFSIGIVAAALCCVLTPIVLTLLGVVSLRAIAGDLFLPLLIGVVALAALALGLRTLARRRRSANDDSRKKA